MYQINLMVLFLRRYKNGQFLYLSKSESPNLINIIELRETIKSKGPSPSSTVRIYYGKRGSILEKYKEVTLKEMYTTDNFNINWRNDEQVQVEVLEENVVTATIVIDLSK